MEEASKITAMIRDLGVPIVMLMWFMFRMEKKLDAATAALNSLVESLARKE